MKPLPSNFSSYEEYNGYMSCCKKAQLGDTVCAYFTRVFEKYKPSGNKTDFVLNNIKIVGKGTVGGLNNNDFLVLGMNDNSYGFWPKHPQEVTNDYQGIHWIKNINEFNHFFFAHTCDIKICKIIRQSS